MAEGHQDSDQTKQSACVGREAVTRLRRRGPARLAGPLPERAGRELRQPAHGVRVQRKVARNGGGRKARVVGASEDRPTAPGDQDDDHDRRHVHDPERVVGGLVQAPRVAPPEVDRDEHRDARGPKVGGLLRGVARVAKVGHGLGEEPDDVLPRRDSRDRPGQDVIEHQRRHGEFCQAAAQGFLDDAVDAAAGEHRARFDVDRPHRVGKEHHRQDEPGSGLPHRLLGDAAYVEGRGAQVAEDDGPRPPERDEGQHHRGGDDDLDARVGSGRGPRGAWARRVGRRHNGVGR